MKSKLTLVLAASMLPLALAVSPKPASAAVSGFIYFGDLPKDPPPPPSRPAAITDIIGAILSVLLLP